MSNTRADGGTLVSQVAAVGAIPIGGDYCKSMIGQLGTLPLASFRCCVDR